MQILIAKKYKIIKKISQGAFGQIFHAININTGQQLAIKLEKIDNKYPQLIHQAKILQNLLNNSTITDKGLPNLYHYGQEGEYNAMVMDLLGPSLQSLLQKNGGTFSTKTTLMLFSQMIKRVEYMHSRQYLHRDIKPDNFLVGLRDKKQKVFLIDFGLSKRFIKNKTHLPYIEGRSMIGTVRYASVNTHLGVQPTRRDDLESLVYIVCYFLYGKLPWQGQTAPTLVEKYNKILAIKVENKPEALFKNLPAQMRNQLTDIFKHIRGLKYDEKPNYEFIKVKVREALQSLGFENDYLFDWSEKSKQDVDRVKKTVSLMKNSKSSSKYMPAAINTPKPKGSRFERSNQRKQQKNEKVSQKKNQLTLEQTLQKLKLVKTSSKK